MAKRRTQLELAEMAEARVRKEKARLELSQLKLKQDVVKERRKMFSVHRAAERNRFNTDWLAPATSADGSIIPDLNRLNARARQMVRDDAFAKSIVRSFKRNVIGTGITAAVDEKPYKKEWQRWARSAELMDKEKRRTFVQVQQWVVSEMVTVGEAFVVRWIIGRGAKRRLVLQCFESEQLDQYKFEERSTGNEVRGGIEVNEDGAAVAYHFYRRHPHDIRGLARPAPLTLESIRVPASMVCHCYEPERVRQTRAVSRLAPVLQKIRDLSEYDASQLRVARAEASIGLIVKGSDSDDKLELDGLNVGYIHEDEEITSFTPTRPGGTYDPFVRMQLRAIGAGAGVSYDQIARDFDSGSYSAKRQGSLEDRREFEPLQGGVVSQLCDPVIQDFAFVWSMQNQALSGDFFIKDEPEFVDWQGQGWEWVDPEQQGKGVERMMRLKLTNRTIEANKLGRSTREIDRQSSADGTDKLVAQINGDGRELPKPDKATSSEVTTDAS